MDRETMLEGAGALLGAWFAAAWADDRRRAHEIAFAAEKERRAFDPASRARHAVVGALPAHLAAPYAMAGRAAQKAFWEPDRSPSRC